MLTKGHAAAETDRSARSLAVELNKRGVPAPNCGEWDWSHIKNILKHSVYIGCLTYGRRRAGLYHHVGADGEIVSSRTDVSDNGQYAPIVVPNNHEALVDQSTFDAVQAKLKARSKTMGGPYRKYLPSGILRSGHCGSILVGARQGGRWKSVKAKSIQDSLSRHHRYASATTTAEFDPIKTDRFRITFPNPAESKEVVFELSTWRE